MREEFIRRALETHANLTLEMASNIFEMIAGFSGYGFLLSHSVAFAISAAHTAYLKALHPAAFLAAVLEHAPGMYPRLTITQEAKKLGIPVLPVFLEVSETRFKLERVNDILSVCLPFTAIEGVSETAARVIVLERDRKAFTDLEDAYKRLPLPRDTLEALVKANALEAFGTRRDVLWALGMLEGKGLPRSEVMQAQLFNLPAISDDDLAWLEDLDEHEMVAWDLHSTRTSLETHPLALLRPMLNAAGIKPSNRVHHGQQCAVAGLVIARQRPETARGIVFLFLEDEFGHMQGIIQAELWDALRSTLRSRALVVQGRVQRLRGWKTMVVESVVPITALAAKESEMAYFVR